MTVDEMQDFAGDVQVGPGVRPGWLNNLAYFLVLCGLAYFAFTAGEGGLEGPNRLFLILLAIWLVYTPLAVRKKWFAIRL
ncbi:MAG: hypothetical protein ACE5H9_12605 [Anaerolineae bacterium]